MKPNVRCKRGGLAICLCKRIEKVATRKKMTFEEAVNFLVQEVVTPRRRERIFFAGKVVTPSRFKHMEGVS